MRRHLIMVWAYGLKAATTSLRPRRLNYAWYLRAPGWTVHTVRRRGRKITWVHDPNDVDHEAALVKVQEQVRELIAAKMQEKVRDLLVAMEFARTHGAGPGRRDLVLGEERP